MIRSALVLSESALGLERAPFPKVIRYIRHRLPPTNGLERAPFPKVIRYARELPEIHGSLERAPFPKVIRCASANAAR